MVTAPTLNRHARRKMAKIGGISPDETVDLAAALVALASTASAANSTNEALESKMGEIGYWLSIIVQDGTSLTDAVRLLARTDETNYPGVYPNHHQLILDRGKLWRPSDVTVYSDLQGVPKLPDFSCYENAYLAAGHLGIKYAEGWGLAEIVPDGRDQPLRLVAHHAFCYDPNTGGIVDTSWPWVATEYLGIVYELEQIDEAFTNTHWYGMVPNDELNGYDLLRRGLLGVDYMLKAN